MPAAGPGALVGVTNQYPRAVDIARPLRAAGIPVCIGGFHTAGSLAMLPEPPPEIRGAWDLGVSIFAGEAEAVWTRCCATRSAAPRPAQPGRRPAAVSAALRDPPQSQLPHDLRCRARLSVSMQLLHHHQRPGTQSRYRSADDVEAACATTPLRASAISSYGRQFRLQPQLGADLRPVRPAARRRGHRRQSDHSGRYAVPPDPGLRSQSRPRQRHPGVHRAREHQPGQPDRRQEEAEPDHRLSHHAASMEVGRGHHLLRLHHRLPQRYPGTGAARHRDHQAGTADRPARIFLPDAAAGLGGPPDPGSKRGVDGSRT